MSQRAQWRDYQAFDHTAALNRIYFARAFMWNDSLYPSQREGHVRNDSCERGVMQPGSARGFFIISMHATRA